MRLAAGCAKLSEAWPTVVNSFRGGKPDLAAASAFIGGVSKVLRRSPGLPVTRNWRVARAWLRALVAHHDMVTAAAVGGDVAGLRARLAVLLQAVADAMARARPQSVRAILAGAFNAVAVSIDRRKAVPGLVGLPLPALYLGREPDRDAGLRRPRPEPEYPAAPPVLKAIGSLDSSPLVTPQILKPGVVYDLGMSVKGARWPADATALLIRWLTTCPPRLYDPSPLRIERPPADGEFEERAAVQLRFLSPQSSLADDRVFAAQCLFEGPGGELTEVPVVGHHELTFRVSDVPLVGVDTGNRQVDLHLSRLLTDLRSALPNVVSELPDLLRVLETLVAVIGAFAQEGLFKGRGDVSEKEFQREVVRAMRVRLGPDVQEHGDLAGGILDIRHRGTVVELTVEKGTGDRQRIAKKYTAQPTQYAGTTARQVSVVFVLDRTEKRNPPGDIRNDVLLVDVPTHGGPEAGKAYPSKAFVLVLNGNVRNPSSYS